MTLLRGYNPNRNPTGEFCGKYSFGNVRSTLLSRQNIEQELLPAMLVELARAGVAHRLGELDVMDIGIDCQSIGRFVRGKNLSIFDWILHLFENRNSANAAARAYS